MAAMVAVALVTILVAVVPAASVRAGAAADPYAALDDSMQRRVLDDGLDGGGLLVVLDHLVLHRATFGDLTPSTAIPIASASKWLTSATLMTLVDDGRLALDDPVAKYLPSFGGGKGKITVRHLLSHTSGLTYDACIGDPGTTTASCVDRIARGPDPERRPGTRFAYSGVGYEVAARVIEVLTGQSFEDAFEARVAHPLGMTATRFDEYDGQRIRHPQPAGSGISTLDDYAAFIDMLAHRGVVGSTRVLSEASVAEIERDQVRGIDTSGDGAVQTTGIPTYGLGVWRDVVSRDDEAQVVSGNGAYGFYPWIDRRHGTYGIVEVADLVNGPEHAVPASQRQARKAWRIAARTP
jgi:CubicO group peptidase (beta-lactamase class C family)